MIRTFNCILLFHFWSVQAQTYCQTFPKEVQAVESFQRKHSKTLDSIFQKHRVDPMVALSIVAPEIGHFSIFQDKMEVSVVTLFYVEMGTEYNNFSIGYYQMKPKFAEQVEQAVLDLGVPGFESLSSYQNAEPHAVREERVKRLQSVKYQTVYLAAFVKICESRFLNWFDMKKQPVRLLAAAYNYGFWNAEKDIVGWQPVKNFPKKNSFAYADVAWEYFSHLKK